MLIFFVKNFITKTRFLRTAENYTVFLFFIYSSSSLSRSSFDTMRGRGRFTTILFGTCNTSGWGLPAHVILSLRPLYKIPLKALIALKASTTKTKTTSPEPSGRPFLSWNITAFFTGPAMLKRDFKSSLSTWKCRLSSRSLQPPDKYLSTFSSIVSCLRQRFLWAISEYLSCCWHVVQVIRATLHFATTI